MNIPYIGFGNDTLEKLPIVQEGEEVPCGVCSGMHPLECATEDSVKTMALMFYRCPATGKNYLGAVNGKLTMFKKADISGAIGIDE